MATNFFRKSLLQVLHRGVLVGKIELHHLVLADGDGHLERHDFGERDGWDARGLEASGGGLPVMMLDGKAQCVG